VLFLFCVLAKEVKAMKLNGKTIDLMQECSLLDFLALQQFDWRAVAVERNGMIIPKAEFGTVRISDADILEVVRFVGGGCL
jgi:sulfur carrier protein